MKDVKGEVRRVIQVRKVFCRRLVDDILFGTRTTTFRSLISTKY